MQLQGDLADVPKKSMQAGKKLPSLILKVIVLPKKKQKNKKVYML